MESTIRGFVDDPFENADEREGDAQFDAQEDQSECCMV
jgi:hypothetical protein